MNAMTLKLSTIAMTMTLAQAANAAGPYRPYISPEQVAEQKAAERLKQDINLEAKMSDTPICGSRAGEVYVVEVKVKTTKVKRDAVTGDLVPYDSYKVVKTYAVTPAASPFDDSKVVSADNCQ